MVNTYLALLVEVLAIWSFGVFAMRRGVLGWSGPLASLVTVVVAIFLWHLFAAHDAPLRLGGARLLGVKTAVFVLASICLLRQFGLSGARMFAAMAALHLAIAWPNGLL